MVIAAHPRHGGERIQRSWCCVSGPDTAAGHTRIPNRTAQSAGSIRQIDSVLAGAIVAASASSTDDGRIHAEDSPGLADSTRSPERPPGGRIRVNIIPKAR